MRLLLDTHVWLWMIARPERLSAEARARLEDPANELFLSAASAWEISIKHRLGKLELPEPPERLVPSRLARDGVTPLPVTVDHALRVAVLPDLHRDPFDRLLVAQAQIEGLVLVTADPAIAGYGAEILRADG
jgi:PIN domain nuclease of toxin-antitoxin system